MFNKLNDLAVQMYVYNTKFSSEEFAIIVWFDITGGGKTTSGGREDI